MIEISKEDYLELQNKALDWVEENKSFDPLEMREKLFETKLDCLKKDKEIEELYAIINKLKMKVK